MAHAGSNCKPLGFHRADAAKAYIKKQSHGQDIWIVTMVRNRWLRDISSLFEVRLFGPSE